MTDGPRNFRWASIVGIVFQLLLGRHAEGASIVEAATGGASGTSWNQASQWTGGAVPAAGNNYVLFTNTSNNSTLSSYYGVSFGTGYIRTPADGNASVFAGDCLILPPGTEILIKETSGGSANASLIFTNYNNINATGLYPLARLAPNTSGGTAALTGVITNLVDSYLANDAGAAMTFNIKSTVAGSGNLTLVSANAGVFSATRTNLVTGDWSSFAGTLSIGNATVGGVVELNNSAFNPNMILAMPQAKAVLILDKAISVKSFTIASSGVSAGTYTPAQLAALGLGGTFSGGGSLTVLSNSLCVPAGLTAVPGNTQVVLAWQTACGADSYNVKRSSASGAETIVANVSGTNCVDTGLVNGQEYYYEISALDENGNESGNSTEVNATPAAPPDHPKILKVYLQGGQSNSDGRALTNGLPASLLQPQADVPLYYYLAGGAANGDGTPGTLTPLRPGISALGAGTTFGPELAFGRTLADYYALTNGVSTNTVMIAIIKYADGGTSLVANWVPNGNSTTNGDGTDYVIFQQTVSAGLSRLATAYPSASIELDGMIWVQGETDIDDGAMASAAYGTNLVRFINDVRLTYATNQPYGTNLPFFLSRISANQTTYSLTSDSGYNNYLLLRAGQQFAATNLANVCLIDTDPAQFSTLTPWSSPGLHFDTQGQQSLGTALAQSVIQALPPPVLQVPRRVDNGWRLNFTGVSGTFQSVQQSSNLAGPWTLVTNILVGPAWTTNWIDCDPPFPAGFYRLSRP